MNVRFFFLAMIAIALSGCVTTQPTQITKFYIQVDALNSQKAEDQKKFIVVPTNEHTSIDDLQFKEYANYLIRVLIAKGFILAKSTEEVNIIIALSYGIGDPKTQQITYNVPVWGQTGVSTSTTQGTATPFGGYSATTTYTPNYGVTGYRTEIENETTYYRYAVIAGYDFKELVTSKKPIELWRTVLTSTGSSGDLRQVFPLLISAGAPYFSGRTEKKIEIVLTENDDIVRAVKGLPIEEKKELKEIKKSVNPFKP